MKKHTVITGASSGLGKAFAYEFAHRGHHLILVSLANENLSELAHEITQKFAIKIAIYEADLSERNAIENFTDWLRKHQFEIEILVNNAGIGGSKNFNETDTDQLDRIIQLNVRGTALLTRSLLPMLMQNSTSYILNVSSIAAFSPLPYKMVYPATKAFIYSFSLGLRSELRKSGVKVTVVNPGAMPTNHDIQARINKQGWIGKIASTKPEYVAKRAIDGVFAGKTIVIPGFVNRINYLAFKFMPWWLIEPLVSRIIRRELTAKTI